jgi:S-adenosylhomocysteine hydrolase
MSQTTTIYQSLPKLDKEQELLYAEIEINDSPSRLAII